MLAEAGLQPLTDAQLDRFVAYLDLLQKWNARLNLTAIRDTDGILSRHFVECIACAQALPSGLSTLLDLGSGAGFPGIPIAVCRPEIAVTLAESQSKKAAFLQEVIRSLQVPARVLAGRAETLTALFDCVALRAVDRMESAIAVGARLIRPGGLLAPMTTYAELPVLQLAAGPHFQWQHPISLPFSEERILALAIRVEC
jgi:16S rRNA (guanine527-N7)-methyltransferase